MVGISRYEKMALVGMLLYLLACGGVIVIQPEEDGSWRVSARPETPVVLVTGGDDRPDSLLPGEKIDINTAPARELERLPGIGESRAEEIVAYRALHGPFSCAEDLDAVYGIGPGIISRVCEYVTVS